MSTLNPKFEDMPQMLAQILNAQTEQQKEIATLKENLLNQAPAQKELLSIPETCELLGINRSTLWKWEKTGVVIAYGIEKRRYFKRSEILANLIPLKK